MKIHSSFLLFCITVLLFSACKSKEVVTNPKPKSEGELSKAELLDHIQENRFDFDYLVIRGKAVADKPEGGEQHFNYKISMARDSLLLLSVSLMGIEGMKLLVRPDSIFARLSLEPLEEQPCPRSGHRQDRRLPGDDRRRLRLRCD